MAQSRIPLYLITGFLESGKTSLIRDTLGNEQFDDGRRTVILMCEDGEEEYDTEKLKKQNCVLIPVEKPEDMNDDFLNQINSQYKPQRVLIEYNGMWPLDILRQLNLPDGWSLFQAIDMADGTTFEMYLNNLKSMVVDMVTDSDLIIVNRCTEDMPLSSWKRSMRAVNRMGEIVFEDTDGMELEVEEILPYSLEGDSFEIEDIDYGIWYIDAQEHPERYIGKTITMKTQVMIDKRMPKDMFITGRNAMTCCEEDIRFFGYVCKFDKAKKLRNGEWVTVTAGIRMERSPAYRGEGIVLYAKSVVRAERPEDPLAYFR